MITFYRLLGKRLRSGLGLGLLALSVLLLGGCLLPISVQAQEVDLSEDSHRFYYAIGVNTGRNMLAQQVISDAEMQAFLDGIQDSLPGSKPLLTDEEITTAIQIFQAVLQQQAAEAAASTAAAGEDFLADNAERDEVVVLDSGLQYEVLESGPAGPSPAYEDSVLAHYHGTLIDGSVFDSSVERGQPVPFPVNGVIAGWTEALQLMKAGDKWRLYIPAELAYGASSPSEAIPPNSTLIFDVELLEINP